MKKIVFLLSAFALVLTSCSSDDDSSSTSSTENLPKTITDVSPLDGTLTSNYTYNGNKLVKVTDSDGFYEEYTYTGDKITKVEYFSDDDFLEQRDNYTYDSQGRVTSYQRLDLDDEIGNRDVYTYNSNGTVSTEKFIGDEVTQTQSAGSEIIYFTNGEVTKIETYDDDADLLSTYSYTYDSKNDVFKNVTGFQTLNFIDGDAIGKLHNLLTIDYEFVQYTNTIIYNSDDYPTTIVEKDNTNTVTSTTTIVYQ